MRLADTAGLSILAMVIAAALGGCAATSTPTTAPAATPLPATEVATPEPTGVAVSAPPPTETAVPATETATPVPSPLPPIVEIPEVPTYPKIVQTVGYDALGGLNKCGNAIFRHYDIYYSVDYGGELSKEEKASSPLNQDILDFYKQQFAAAKWLVYDMKNPIGAVLHSVFWEDEGRAYDPAADQPPFVGSCYLVIVKIQPPGADLEVIADIER